MPKYLQLCSILDSEVTILVPQMAGHQSILALLMPGFPALPTKYKENLDIFVGNTGNPG